MEFGFWGVGVKGMVGIGGPNAVWLLDIDGIGVGRGVIHIAYNICAGMLRIRSGGMKIVSKHDGHPLHR